MNDPGGLWGLAIGLGTLALGLAFAYANMMRARRLAQLDDATGRQDPSDRWRKIGVATLVGLGILIVCYFLFRATPGVTS